MGTAPLSLRVDEETREAVERYQDQQDLDTLGAAGDELLQLGLREANGPMLHRIHERAVDAAYHLLLVAAVTIVVGLTTTALSTPHGVQIALVILALAVGPLALIELARVVRGQSVVGLALRGDQV